MFCIKNGTETSKFVFNPSQLNSREDTSASELNPGNRDTEGLDFPLNSEHMHWRNPPHVKFCASCKGRGCTSFEATIITKHDIHHLPSFYY